MTASPPAADIAECQEATAAPAGDPARLARMCDLLAAWVAAPPERLPDGSPEEWLDFRLAAQVHGVAPLLARRLGLVQATPATSAGATAAVGTTAAAASTAATTTAAFGTTAAAAAAAITPIAAPTAATAAVAGPAAAWLAGEHTANRLRVARLHDDLRAILARFATAGVALMPLKGAVLGPAWYADPAERPMADLDLLVRADDLARGVRLLAEIGYETVFEGRKHVKLAPRGTRRAPVAEQGAGGGGEHPDNPRWVELHPACGEWLGDERIDLSGPIWATASRQTLLGEPAWLPEPATHWLYLLVHASHHVLINRFRLIQLIDLLLLGAAVPAGAALQVEPPPAAAGMARALYPPLALLLRTFPEGAAAVPPDALAAAAALHQHLRAHLAPGFLAWADGLDLYHASYLDPAPWRAP